MIPYGRQSIDEEDIKAVVDVLRSDYLTTGPQVAEFEEVFADYVGAKEAVAVSSGTAALHCAMYALDIGEGEEVIVPPITFAATANSVVFQGGTPVFADVEADTLLLDPKQVAEKITERTKAIIAVDFAGQPCDYDDLKDLAHSNGLALVADACHALGASYKKKSVGSLADLNTFSFHPVKHITTGEGGMITTADPELARQMRLFRNHGIASDHLERERLGSWFYEMVELGYNYRLTDLQCALGKSQLLKLRRWVERRREIARRYDNAFADLTLFDLPAVRKGVYHSYHLYVVLLRLDRLSAERATIFKALRAKGIGANVHYIPVHLHPFYRQRFGTRPGICPVSEFAYERVISLPLFHGMTDEDVNRVVETVTSVMRTFAL
jgi:perosamine synthetase